MFLIQKASKEELPSMQNQLSQFINDRDLSVFAIIITSTSSKDIFKRELLVHSRPSISTSTIEFAAHDASNFQLGDLDNNQGHH